MSGLLGQAGPTPPAATLATGGSDQATPAGAVDEAVRLLPFAGFIVPFGSVIGPLAVWLTRRDRDPFIDQAGREALNFGITITIYGTVLGRMVLLCRSTDAWLRSAADEAVR